MFRFLVIAVGALLVAAQGQAQAKGRHAAGRATAEDYAQIAEGKCREARPNPFEPAQGNPQSDTEELRPLAIYLFARPDRGLASVNVCLNADPGTRTHVYVTYVVYNHMGLMPVYYGDNGHRCIPGSRDAENPLCTATRFVTRETGRAPMCTQVTSSGIYSTVGNRGTVLVTFNPPGKAARRRYYHVPVEVIGGSVIRQAVCKPGKID